MSKIPEGSTHTYSIRGADTYRKKVGGNWYVYSDGEWWNVGLADSAAYKPIQVDIKAEPEWTGEGLPPVGMDCEWKGITRNGWAKVSIIAHGKEEGDFVAIAQAENEVVLGASDRFRLIRTPEQIAAEKRDAAIKEMQRLVGSCNTFPFAELYDYGYRLQVEK